MSKDPTIKDLIRHDLQEYELVCNMLSKTVHDVNNPLAVFIGQLSILDLLKKKDQLTPEKLDKVLSRFKSSTETFNDRLNKLRNYYKILINDDAFSNLTNTLNALVYHFDNMAYKNDINLSHDLATEDEIKLTTPANHVYLITKHLVQNSLESLIANNGERGGNVEIKCEVSEKAVIITVLDDGPGLGCPIETAYESGYTTNPEQHGGFGLAIVKQLLTDNNLDLTYQKEEKCSFSVTYPTK